MLQDFDLVQLAEPLLEWYVGHARVLPWREEPTPYRVWVSEIMLQQTRVEAVKPYFERFTASLPNVAALAHCPEDELLKLWEGLGYYNRVRNMQKAAIQVMEEYQGELPAEYEELLKLKGIGHYTAGAVASIAYGKYVPAVDGNVLRVITRATLDDTDIMRQSFRSRMERELFDMMQRMTIQEPIKKQIYKENIPGAFNQALMELGATVCLPNGAPLCEKCPWSELCLAKKENRITELPVKSKAKARRIEKRTVFILRDGDKVAIRKRPEQGLLAGLYELPNIEGDLNAEEALAQVKQMHYMPIRIQKLTEAKHVFSHIEWHMRGYAILVEEAGLDEETSLTGHKEGDNQAVKQESEIIFVEAKDASARYAIPAAFGAYAKYMNIKLGNERFAE